MLFLNCHETHFKFHRSYTSKAYVFTEVLRNVLCSVNTALMEAGYELKISIQDYYDFLIGLLRMHHEWMMKGKTTEYSKLKTQRLSITIS